VAGRKEPGLEPSEFRCQCLVAKMIDNVGRRTEAVAGGVQVCPFHQKFRCYCSAIPHGLDQTVEGSIFMPVVGRDRRDCLAFA